MINMGGVIEVKVTKASTRSTMLKSSKWWKMLRPKAKRIHFKVCPLYPDCQCLCVVDCGISVNRQNFRFEFEFDVNRFRLQGDDFPCYFLSVRFGHFHSAIVLRIGIASSAVSSKDNYLEALNNVEQVVFDKTGTLTKENSASKVVPMNRHNRRRTAPAGGIRRILLNPSVGISIVDEYGRDRIFPEIIAEFTEFSGGVTKATINDAQIMVGNSRLMKKTNLKFRSR